MASSKPTTLSKILITGVILAIIFFGVKWFTGNNSGNSAASSTNTTAPSKSRPSSSNGIQTYDIGVVTWGGYAGGQYFNEGFQANQKSRFYKEYGFMVEFHVLDDYVASRDAFKAGEVDLLWNTIDAFPCEVASMSDFDPQVLWQADWSRGGDAMVVRRGINNFSDLKGKKMAVAPMTPSHTFLIWSLDAAGMTMNDVTLIEVGSAIEAAELFKSGEVDAAVVWSPDDADCVAQVSGAKVLESTKNASHIIADVFIGKREFVKNHKENLIKLYEGWMIGAAEINGSMESKRKAAQILTEGLGMPYEFCFDAINNVRLTTHGDNVNFFGLNADYQGVTGEDLYSRMKVVYKDLGYAKGNIPSWRLIANSSLVNAANLTGPDQEAETATRFTAATDADRDKEAYATKEVSVNFAVGQSRLDVNAKNIIDREFTSIAKAFSNARIRIEGNTDNTGGHDMNVALSKKRAASVANYLAKEHNMDPNRFIIVGNGPDNPTASNNTAKGRAKNRRTDFELVSQ